MSASTLRIGVLMPEVLGTYGDSGNALILAERARRDTERSASSSVSPSSTV